MDEDEEVPLRLLKATSQPRSPQVRIGSKRIGSLTIAIVALCFHVHSERLGFTLGHQLVYSLHCCARRTWLCRHGARTGVSVFSFPMWSKALPVEEEKDGKWTAFQRCEARSWPGLINLL